MRKKMAEKDLTTLIKNMKPSLNSKSFIFSTHSYQAEIPIPQEARIMEFREPEGITLIVSREDADRYGIAYDIEMSWIILTIHSALDAVGFTASFSSALASEDISCNVIAGYHHDHIFVPIESTDKAMHVLHTMV